MSILKSSNLTENGEPCLVDLYEKKDKSLDFVDQRISFFETIYEQQQNVLKEKANTEESLKISYKESIYEGKKGATTPFDIAKKISNKFSKSNIVSKVNGKLYDFHRPLEENCEIEFYGFNSDEGRRVFWHSSAHILGQSMERLFAGHLTIGPPLEDCFYYDIDIKERKINHLTYDSIEKLTKKIIKENQPFQRIVLNKKQALELFKYNKYKIDIINEKIEDGMTCTAYRNGPFIDLCSGPHIPSTGLVKAFKLIKHSSCYWKGLATNQQLQRVYGISFPDQKLLKKRLKEIKLAKERDHRKIGSKQQLFMTSSLSPGSIFWFPRGAIIYNKLLKFLRSEYRKRGYKEVISPNIYNMDLWKISGHAVKFKDDMFVFKVENQEFAMKPMNCPGHCLMFKQMQLSYRDMPVRLADFGVLHRNELSGTLSGLTRVRRFQQDDAHIFCSVDQILKEVNDCLDFMKFVYGIFGFEFSLVLSTRPSNFLGEISIWDKAEKALKQSLDESEYSWKINEGDGAFYGPKIDILLHDAMNRSIQCATIQLDFNLPSDKRFNLQFINSEGKKEQPVIVHRAILGSVERFMSILAEHCGGKWPFWISPRQIIVVPISDKYLKYAEEIYRKLYSEGFDIECDRSNNQLKKKIREAEILYFNFILVVGEEEMNAGTVNVRERSNKVHETKTIDEVICMFKELELNYK